LFSSLLESCVSFRFYKRAIELPISKVAVYLTLLAAISACSLTLYVQQVILPKLNEASSQLPTITIKNGQVSVESTEVAATAGVLFSDPEKILRIDLALDGNKAAIYAATDYDYTLVITKYTVILKQRFGQTYSAALPYGFSLTIYKNRLQAFIESWRWMILGFVFLASFAVFLGLKFALAFALTIPGLIAWGILRRDLTYGKLMILCIYAVTPAMFLGILLLWLNTRFVLPPELVRHQFWLYLIVGMEYVLGGLLALAPPPQYAKASDKISGEPMLTA
jgi:hypothetical protein